MQGWSSHTEKKCKPSEDHWISRVSIPFCYFQQVPSPANWSSFFPNNPGSVLPRKMVVYGYHQSNLSSTGPWSRTKPCLMKRYQKWRIQQTESKTFTSFASTRSKILCFWMPESEHVIHHLNLSGGAWPKIHLGLVSFLLVEESLFQKLFEKKEKKKEKKRQFLRIWFRSRNNFVCAHRCKPWIRVEFYCKPTGDHSWNIQLQAD